jgi:hypothetical protein
MVRPWAQRRFAKSQITPDEGVIRMDVNDFDITVKNRRTWSFYMQLTGFGTANGEVTYGSANIDVIFSPPDHYDVIEFRASIHQGQFTGVRLGPNFLGLGNKHPVTSIRNETILQEVAAMLKGHSTITRTRLADFKPIAPPPIAPPPATPLLRRLFWWWR